MSSNSANGRRAKDPKWTKYIAAIDANSINPDGSDADASFILDAIPYSEIERISKENMLQPFTNEMAFDFLLLNVTDSRAVRARLGDLYQWVLLCGDADYTSIPDCYKQGLTGLVAPHHGGAITPGSTPNAVGHGRMVFSTYKGCYSNVPSSDTAAEARKMGWRISETSDRRKCNRGHCVRGNRLIRLGCTPECGCGKVVANCLCLSQL